MSESKGLGDTIEKIARKTRIKKLVESYSKAVKKPCGCSKRRDKLNKKFPYKKKNENV